jgi:hypothetical protein
MASGAKVLQLCLGIFMLCLLSTPAVAATVTASSCSAAAVQSAVNAASSGDTVAVPAGNCTWTTTVDIPAGKNITIQGAGIDVTTITRTGKGQSFNIGNTASRIIGFTFNLGGVYSGGTAGPGSVANNDWRIDHNRFIGDGSGGYAIIIIKCSESSAAPGVHCRGLIDNNTFENGANPWPMGFTIAADMHRTFALPTDLGGPNTVFVEDNTFIKRNDGNVWHYVDTNYGGRVVFRFNNAPGFGAEIHSLASGPRGARAWEIYKNTVPWSGWTAGLIRGGTGIAWGNQHDGGRSPWALDNVRSFEFLPHYYGDCVGTSTADGNTPGQNGWPCRDQLGRGTDACLSNPSDGTGSATGWCAQASEPVYFFLNRTGTTITEIETRSALYPGPNPVQLDRDVYNEVSPFNGTSGVGSGPLANRPSTCTVGVAYWATDQGSWNQSGSGGQGQLYKCAATNTWSLYYVPYTYPHPLRQQGGAIPPAPTNLIVK